MTASPNPLATLAALGQSPWLDFIERRLIDSGELERLVRDDALRGLTSNPAIFEKAIAESQDYTKAIAELALVHEGDASAVYEALAVRDIRDACDVLSPVYRRTSARDGYASLEVSPRLAHDAAGTIAEARRLWAAVARPNLMVKVPATPAGLVAIRQLIEDGINVNVTLLFAEEMYAAVAEAYLSGLEARARASRPLDRIASVASFFISRIDTMIDAELEKLGKPELCGKAAIANAKRTYQRYLRLFSGPRWEALASKGAATQRLLWASTSTKNPKYRDVIYVEELAGPDTVNTLPPATLAAFRDHGVVRRAIDEGVEQAERELAAIAAAGVSLERVTAALLADGLAKFVEPFDKLLAAVTRRARQVMTPATTSVGVRHLPAAIEAEIIARLDAQISSARLFGLDASLWTGGDEARWLGWLDCVGAARDMLDGLARLSMEVQGEGLTHVLLLGMGGSSLAPEVFASVLGRAPGAPELLVVDTTEPAQIRAIEAKVDLSRTLVVASSKSGGTLETAALGAYFFERLEVVLGPKQAGRRFVAITDPGSALEARAKRDGYRAIVHGVPSVGGRFSALSPFGLVPAALLGLDLSRLFGRAERMLRGVRPETVARDNPGMALGVALGRLALHGKDKLTLVASPALAPLGAWIEQLVAESTGKRGKAILPVDREALGPPSVYGDDRVFVYLRLEEAPHAGQDAAVAALEAAGHAVIRLSVPSTEDLFAEMLRWEVATAYAGVELGIHPFDQPDVEASKLETKKLMSEGAAAPPSPLATDGPLSLFGAPGAFEAGPADAILRQHFGRIGKGDYLAILAYLPMSAAIESQLMRVRHRFRDGLGVATMLGFGPRFLHSSGQAYKGGPASGVFLVLTADAPHDLRVPGEAYTFGQVIAAQARGDTAVLEARGRRVLRVHLGSDVAAGLAALERALSR